MKYIGPFLRINSLTPTNVANQLLYFSRESLKHIALYSKCGITTSLRDLKVHSSPNIDINIFKENSPLLCLYKKANDNLIKDKYGLYWDDSSFKKEINISGNAYMTLSLLNLCDYYYSFEEVDKKLYTIGYLYSSMAKNQLDFYLKYLRNDDGIFVDKKHLSSSEGDIKFEYKDTPYKVCDQCFLMVAYYKYYLDINARDGEQYKNFANDIFNMFLNYKEELYDLSLEELCDFITGLNMFYFYSKDSRAQDLILDLMDLSLENLYSEEYGNSNSPKEYALLLINMYMFNKNLNLNLFEEEKEFLLEKLNSCYDENTGIFLKKKDKKEVSYYGVDVLGPILALYLYNEEDIFSNKIVNGYKKGIISSGIIGSWPDTPSLNSVERYKNFSLKSEDLLDEANFRQSVIPCPETALIAPIFYKAITFSNKKQQFKGVKTSFDCEKSLYPVALCSFILSYF